MGLRQTERGPDSPRSELQKAVCGWSGAQLQALLEAISDSNKRMPEARDAKGAIVVSAGRDKVLADPQSNCSVYPLTPGRLGDSSG